uniref:Uncharacterized protein n=1 Tax=Anguilla anguilla TaxID=7936 RepID=A0A0E9W8C8_ANGAN
MVYISQKKVAGHPFICYLKLGLSGIISSQK